MDVPITCPCPPKADGEPRHEADTVTLRDRLDFHSATTIRKALGMLYMEDPGASNAEALAVVTENYVLFGIAAWSFVDERGKPTPVSKGAIRMLMEEHPEIIEPVGDEADKLYAEQVMLPLLGRAQKSLPPTPMVESTSAKSGSGSKRPRPLKRSSTTTTPTDATGKITQLPVGASSSSPSRASAR